MGKYTEKLIATQIKQNNLWYVEEQFSMIKKDHQKRTVFNRWNLYTKIIDKHTSSLPNKHEFTFLDAGCGDGVNIEFFSKLNALKITGIDYNSLRVQRASEKFLNAEFFTDDLVNINLSINFDIIFCNHVLEHIPKDQKVLNNFHNKLNDDGLLIIGVPNEGCLFAKLRNNIFDRWIIKQTDHVNFYTLKEIKNKLLLAQFEIVDVYHENFFYPIWRLQKFIMSRNWGFQLSQLLRKLFPGQAAGLIIVCKKKR